MSGAVLFGRRLHCSCEGCTRSCIVQVKVARRCRDWLGLLAETVDLWRRYIERRDDPVTRWPTMASRSVMCPTTAPSRTVHPHLNGELEVRPIRHRLPDPVRDQVVFRTLSLLPQLVPETSPRADPVSRPRRTRHGRLGPQSRRCGPAFQPRAGQGLPQRPPTTTPAQLHQPARRPDHLCANVFSPPTGAVNLAGAQRDRGVQGLGGLGVGGMGQAAAVSPVTSFQTANRRVISVR